MHDQLFGHLLAVRLPRVLEDDMESSCSTARRLDAGLADLDVYEVYRASAHVPTNSTVIKPEDNQEIYLAMPIMRAMMENNAQDCTKWRLAVLIQSLSATSFVRTRDCAYL